MTSGPLDDTLISVHVESFDQYALTSQDRLLLGILERLDALVECVLSLSVDMTALTGHTLNKEG